MLPSANAAGLELQAGGQARQAAVARRAEPDVDGRGRGRVRHPHVLVTGQLEPDGTPQHEGGAGATSGSTIISFPPNAPPIVAPGHPDAAIGRPNSRASSERV